MTSSLKLASLGFTASVVLAAACSSSNLISPNHDGSVDTQSTPLTGSGGSTGTGGCTGTAMRVEIPSEHRAVASACAPSTRSPAIPDAGLLSCTTDADCAQDGGAATYFGTCLHGQCSFDHCLTDADCGATEVCVCANDYYGGNTAYHANVCVPANCRVDSDCGSGGYCSPSRGGCGGYLGYYCHTAKDRCVNATTDCAACNTGAPACTYEPTAGMFVCGSIGCAG